MEIVRSNPLEEIGQLLGSGTLLIQDPVRDRHRLLIASLRCYPTQPSVGRDLQMLKCVGLDRHLGRPYPGRR